MLHTVRLRFLIALVPALLAAQGPWEQTFPDDVTAPERFRNNRTSYSALMDVMRPKRAAVSDEQLDVLSSVQLEAVWGAMGDYRATNFVRGFQSTQPGKRLVGRALTIRFLPFRKDLNAAAREHGLSYSRFIYGLREAGVEVDRKVLAELAVNEPAAFAELAELAKQPAA